MPKLKREHKLIDSADIDWRYNVGGTNSRDKHFVYRGDILEMKGNLFSRCYHTECSGIISDYIYYAQDNEYDYGEITDWWRCNYCDSCKNADENLDCDYTDGGVMDRVCWCTHYEKREKKPVEDPLIPKDAGDHDYSGLLDE